MTLKSLQQNPNERKILWCLEERVINEALKNTESRNFLQSSNMVIIQLPISKLETILNPALAELQQNVDLKPDEILIYDESDQITRIKEQYVPINKVINDFLNFNLELARSYARFCACLGAKSFEFKHSNKEASEHNFDASFNVGGMVNQITDVDAKLALGVKKTLDQILDMSNTFEPDMSIDRADRINAARKVMKEDGLENDSYCKHILKMFTDCYTQLSTEKISLNRKSDSAKSLNIVAELKAKMPQIPLDIESFSIASFKAKLELASKISEEFNLIIEVKF